MRAVAIALLRDTAEPRQQMVWEGKAHGMPLQYRCERLETQISCDKHQAEVYCSQRFVCLNVTAMEVGTGRPKRYVICVSLWIGQDLGQEPRGYHMPRLGHRPDPNSPDAVLAGGICHTCTNVPPDNVPSRRKIAFCNIWPAARGSNQGTAIQLHGHTYAYIRIGSPVI